MLSLSLMSEQARKLLGEALQLSIKERAEVAAELLASMDGEPDADVEAAWAAEIEHRGRRALVGQGKGADWSEVRSRIESRFKK